jgi:hypothetical protein
MNVKLTLSINEKTIERAKRISRQKGKSISKMVEEYLDSVAEKEANKESRVDRILKIVAKSKNKIKIPDNVSYKEMIHKWRYEDYMNDSAKKMKTAKTGKK